MRNLGCEIAAVNFRETKRGGGNPSSEVFVLNQWCLLHILNAMLALLNMIHFVTGIKDGLDCTLQHQTGKSDTASSV